VFVFIFDVILIIIASPRRLLLHHLEATGNIKIYIYWFVPCIFMLSNKKKLDELTNFNKSFYTPSCYITYFKVVTFTARVRFSSKLYTTWEKATQNIPYGPCCHVQCCKLFLFRFKWQFSYS